MTSVAKSNHEKQVNREKLVIIPCSQYGEYKSLSNTNQRFICHVLIKI